MAQVQEITLKVPDVSCEHCVRSIAGALTPVEGVESFNTDLATKTVSLRFNPDQVSLDTIEEALDEAGYPVTK